MDKVMSYLKKISGSKRESIHILNNWIKESEEEIELLEERINKLRARIEKFKEIKERII